MSCRRWWLMRAKGGKCRLLWPFAGVSRGTLDWAPHSHIIVQKQGLLLLICPMEIGYSRRRMTFLAFPPHLQFFYAARASSGRRLKFTSCCDQAFSIAVRHDANRPRHRWWIMPPAIVIPDEGKPPTVSPGLILFRQAAHKVKKKNFWPRDAPTYHPLQWAARERNVPLSQWPISGMTTTPRSPFF